MKVLKAIIIEDEEQSAINLNSKLKDLPFIKVVATCNNLDNGEKEILYHRPKLLFLDIEVNGQPVFEMLKKLESRKLDFGILFITAHHDKYLLDAINKCALRYRFAYLGKPINWIKLVARVNAMRKEMHKGEETKGVLMIPFQGGMIRLFYDEILYCEAHGNQSIIYTTDQKKEILNFNLKQLEEKLLSRHFYRMSGQYLINSRYLRKAYKSQKNFVVILRIGLNEAKLHLPLKQWKPFRERFGEIIDFHDPEDC